MSEEKNRETEETTIVFKKGWKDIFHVVKYFLPFFLYFAIVWLDNNYASDDELREVNANVINATKLSERAIEENKDLRNDLIYEIKIVDAKIDVLSQDFADIKKYIEQSAKKE